MTSRKATLWAFVFSLYAVITGHNGISTARHLEAHAPNGQQWPATLGGHHGRRTARHPAQPREGEAGARRGGGLDDGAADPLDRDRQIAATAGFDTIYVDVEHNTLSIDAVCQICIAAMQCGITPLVRVPANTPEFICRLLDGGAMGVIAPHVRTAEEAREIVQLRQVHAAGRARRRRRAAALPLPQLPVRRGRTRR